MDRNELLTENCKTNDGRKNWITVLGFRWLFLLFVALFSLAHSGVSQQKAVLLETLAISVIYNVLITLYTLNRKKSGKKVSTAFVYIDILLISILSYMLGGVQSDIFIFLFFIIGYCGIYSDAGNTIRVGAFCIIAYTISCIYQAREYPEGMDYLKLLIRDLTMVMAAYSIIRINREVKKYDELHKKEFKLARTDKLTGLANRHYFDQKLSEELEYADASGSPLNILLFDLDNFKKFNDSYGHIWGDKLLTLFSDIIKQSIRKTDIPVRYGGEEFLILIRDLDIHIAKSVAERIRRQLEKQRIYVGSEEHRQKVTVSCGIAQYPKHSSQIKEVIDLADKALYHAKESGKNLVVIYDEIL